jgi:site-specific recombinase XerD
MSTTDTEEAAERPIAYFLQDIAYQGKSERTQTAYERVLREFERYLADGADRRAASLSLADATHRDCMAYIHSLRGTVADSTVATYASYLHRFYAYMTQVGEFDANPMSVVMEEMDERIETDPTRRDISVQEMRSFVKSIGHPLDRALVVTLLKTGMRVGELCNLDLQDIHLDHEAKTELNASPRVQIAGRPDSVYVSEQPSFGSVVNGEQRTASNKRKRPTVIPIDEELKGTLVRWLAIRPDPVSDSEPLFVNTREQWGERIAPKDVRYIVEQHARDAGWYRSGGGASENVTPHYFRHFFTTHLRDATGDRGIVKYLRGDVADDIIDPYTHNWGGRVREVYEANIYTLQ